MIFLNLNNGEETTKNPTFLEWESSRYPWVKSLLPPTDGQGV